MEFHDSVERILRQKGSEMYSVNPQVTVYDALERMAEKVILKGFSSSDLTVEDIMTSPPVTVEPKTSVDECMRLITVQDLTIHQLEDYISGRYPA